MPVFEAGPLRAVMPIVVTVRGFDTSELVLDLAEHIAAELFAMGRDWRKPSSRLTAYQSNRETTMGLGERIGALVITIAPSQPAPLYTSESDVPDQAVVRILLEQLISPKAGRSR